MVIIMMIITDNFFCVPSYISGVHHFGWDLLCKWSFFLNPTIEVVTLHLCGWCMLGVFLLLPFIRQGHECQDLLSLCDGTHVSTDKTLVYNLIRKSFRVNGVRTHVNSKGKIPCTGDSEEDWTHDTASRRTASPTHYQLSYSGPLLIIIIQKTETRSYREYPTRMVYLHYISCLRYTILVGNPRILWKNLDAWSAGYLQS